MAYLLNTLFVSLIPMCVTALVTMAITLIFKTSNTTNFAQGVISAFGAYVTADLLMKHANLSIWIALPIGILAAAAIAVVIDIGIFRRGRYVNAVGKQIITMGLISIVVGIVPLVFGLATPNIPKFAVGNLSFGNVSVTKNTVVCVAITAVVLAVIFVLLRYSKWGLSVRATASNEYVAGMMGVNTHVVTAVTWGLAGALGALAAVMLASENTTMHVYYMTNYQVYAFLAGIVGGFATFHGPVIVAILIPLLNSLVVWFANTVGVPTISEWSMVIVYAIALVVIFFKPQGIFAKRIEKKV